LYYYISRITIGVHLKLGIPSRSNKITPYMIYYYYYKMLDYNVKFTGELKLSYSYVALSLHDITLKSW